MPSTLLEDNHQIYLDAIETELLQAVKHANQFGDVKLYDMLAYHMGWNGRRSSVLRGKRVRPLLVLLACSAAGGDWSQALPAASAVELVHNFSLIHDDIEDHSPLRRGRPTVWKKWGIPQAINTGDAMFSLAHLEVIRLSETTSASIGLKAVEILQSTCLHLTHGQYLDLSYETRTDLSIEDYWLMVEGKTAALMAACSELGALAAFGSEQVCNTYRNFGRLVGLAFQVQDDLLGIWGNSSVTGKSSQSDLVTGKVTLPVIYGLSTNSEFARRWKQGPIKSDELSKIMELLEHAGAKEFAQSQAQRLLDEAINILQGSHPVGIAFEALRNLAMSLVNRLA